MRIHNRARIQHAQSPTTHAQPYPDARLHTDMTHRCTAVQGRDTDPRRDTRHNRTWMYNRTGGHMTLTATCRCTTALKPPPHDPHTDKQPPHGRLTRRRFTHRGTTAQGHSTRRDTTAHTQNTRTPTNNPLPRPSNRCTTALRHSAWRGTTTACGRDTAADGQTALTRMHSRMQTRDRRRHNRTGTGCTHRHNRARTTPAQLPCVRTTTHRHLTGRGATTAVHVEVQPRTEKQPFTTLTQTSNHTGRNNRTQT